MQKVLLFSVFVGIITSILLSLSLKNFLKSIFHSKNGFKNSKQKITIGNDNFIIARDSNGTPYSWVKNEIQGYKALGFHSARDRGFSFNLLRQILKGELHKISGDNKEAIEIDTFMKNQMFYQYAKDNVKYIQNDQLKNLQAYCDGINEYYTKYAKLYNIPLEFYLTDLSGIGSLIIRKYKYLTKILNFINSSFNLNIFNKKYSKWLPHDSSALVLLMAFFGLADGQVQIEKTFVQLIQESDSHLKFLKYLMKHNKLLNSRLSNEEYIKLIRKIKIDSQFSHKNLFKNSIKKRYFKELSTNNWVISGKKSTTNKPIYCTDPHLQISFIPSFWHEQALIFPKDKDYRIGIYVPGVPINAMGRTKHLSFGFSYGFMDQIDYFIEECKMNNENQIVCKDDDNSFYKIKMRKEFIKTKKRTIPIYLFQTKNGILEIQNKTSPIIENGFYLSRAFSMSHFKKSTTITYNSLLTPGFLSGKKIKTVKDFQNFIQYLEVSTNFLMADDKGNIGYQQTGAAARRPKKITGILPVEGWKKENRYLGAWYDYFINIDKNDKTKYSFKDENQQKKDGIEIENVLLKKLNPKSGFIATANNNINVKKENRIKNGDFEPLVNIPMGSYRFDRIENVLNSKKKHSIEDMKRLHGDTYSQRSLLIMNSMRELITQLLNNNKLKLNQNQIQIAKALLDWNLHFNKNEIGGTIFDEFWKFLHVKLFGKYFGSEESFEKNFHSIENMLYYYYFDLIIYEDENKLSKEEKEFKIELFWGKFENRENWLKHNFVQFLKKMEKKYSNLNNISKWGKHNEVTFYNSFYKTILNKKIGLFLGIHKKIQMNGGKGCVSCLNNYKPSDIVAGQSYRHICDMSNDKHYSILPFGISENFLSNLYSNHVDKFKEFQYNLINIDEKIMNMMN